MARLSFRKIGSKKNFFLKQLNSARLVQSGSRNCSCHFISKRKKFKFEKDCQFSFTRYSIKINFFGELSILLQKRKKKSAPIPALKIERKVIFYLNKKLKVYSILFHYPLVVKCYCCSRRFFLFTLSLFVLCVDQMCLSCGYIHP